jgi:hypothetical protein
MVPPPEPLRGGALAKAAGTSVEDMIEQQLFEPAG